MQAPRAVLTCTENAASFEALVSFAPWVAAEQRGSASGSSPGSLCMVLHSILSRTEAPTRMSGGFQVENWYLFLLEGS